MRGYLSLGYPVRPYEELRNISPLDLIGFLGFDIIHRRGCCRHMSPIHKDIFDKLNLYCENYTCCQFSEDEEVHHIMNPKFNCIRLNHQANIITYHGQYYIHDSFNQTYFYLANSFTAEEYYNFDDKQILCYSPVGNMIFGLSYEQLLMNIQQFQESSLKPHMNVDELNDILLETNDRFYNSRKLLHDFRCEVEPYMKKIIPNQIQS